MELGHILHISLNEQNTAIFKGILVAVYCNNLLHKMAIIRIFHAACGNIALYYQLLI